MSREVRSGGLLLTAMVLFRDDSCASVVVLEVNELGLLGEMDYPVSRVVRHGYDYEVGDLVPDK